MMISMILCPFVVMMKMILTTLTKGFLLARELGEMIVVLILEVLHGVFESLTQTLMMYLLVTQ